MVRVAPINLTFNPKTLWFDPGDLNISQDDAVVVTTARGTEFGVAASDIIEVSEKEIEALKSPLQPVLRLATEEDAVRAAEMEQRSLEALPIFKEMALEVHKDMHPVSVEFLLDGDKAIFYFEAEERIDFRDLVRQLAARFHVRIDMRQIGVRDEARLVGGIGHCGQELCCKRLGGEFSPVSIRMAKEQGLSLNPQKISGLCGRLMCCLRYEFEAYKDFRGRAPKVGATVQTPLGPGKVVDLDIPLELVTVKVEEEKPVKVRLALFEEAAEGTRPSVIGEEAWELATADNDPGRRESTIFSTSQFTVSDKLADGAHIHHAARGCGSCCGASGAAGGACGSSATSASDASPASSTKGKKQRNRKDKGVEAAAAAQASPRKRRRSTKISSESAHAASKGASRATGSSERGRGASRGTASSAPAGKKLRRQTKINRGEVTREEQGANTSREAASRVGAQGEAASRVGAQGEAASRVGAQGDAVARSNAHRETPRATRKARTGADVRTGEAGSRAKSSARPGQKSSGLRGGRASGEGANSQRTQGVSNGVQSAGQSQNSSTSGNKTSTQPYRRRRNRKNRDNKSSQDK
jgi:cell fate regulator YaaT (PSP1 superfamily)